MGTVDTEAEYQLRARAAEATLRKRLRLPGDNQIHHMLSL